MPTGGSVSATDARQPPPHQARPKDNVGELSNLKGMIPMIPCHIHADLASERCNTLLAEAKATPAGAASWP